MFYFGIDKKDWVELEQCSVSSVLGAQIIFDQYGNFSWHLNGLRFRNLILYLKGQTLKTFVPQSDLNFITQSLKPRFLSLDKDLMEGVKSITSSSFKKLSSLSRLIRRTKLSQLEDERFASLFLDYYQVIVNEVFLVNFKPLEIGALEALTELVSEKNKNSVQALHDVAVLTTMDKSSFSSREEIELCQIVTMTLEPAKIRRALVRTKNRARLLQRNYPDLFELFEEHYNKYRFLIGGFSELGWEIDDFIRRYMDLLDLGPDWAADRAEMLSSHTRTIGLKKRKTLSRLKDDGHLRKVSKIINDLAALDENNRTSYSQALEIRELLNNEIIERIGINPMDLRYYTLDEIINLIKDRVRVDHNEITRRTRGLIFNSGIHSHSGSDATRFLDKHIPIKPRKHILTGKCAHPGIHEGKVKIVQTLEDVTKVENGDIVVTPSSGTEFVEAVRKAGGVIIESGGMLSPVTQMCRETNTPCIIQVESALISLSDNDIVVMDVDNQKITFATSPEKHHVRLDSSSVKVYDVDQEEKMVVRLEEVTPNDTHIFGLKSANLALLLREGFQIPPGFALGRSVMYNYLDSKGCKIKNGVYDSNTVEKARKIIIEETATDFLHSLPLDATVIFDEEGCAVRTSRLSRSILNTVELRKTFTSTLAIRTLEGLWKGIRKCWLSFIEQPATLMRDSLDSQTAMGGGVLIQQFKPGDRSGIIKSTDLEHPGSNVMTLEACLGAGHSLYTGKSRPDRYRISRKNERIINRIIPLKTRFEMVQPKTGKLIMIPVPEDIIEAEVLSRQQIRILVHAVLKTEKLLEMPVGLEWTIKAGEIFFLNVIDLEKNIK